MSLSKLISQVASNINAARNAYYDHTPAPDGEGYWKNGGISQSMCKDTVQLILNTAARKLAIEKRLTLSMFGTFSVLDEDSSETGTGVHISFRPVPKLARLIKETPTGKIPSLMKEVSELSSYYTRDLSTDIVTTMTPKFAKDISNEMQRLICDLLISNGKITIQQLGTFLVTNDETPSETVSLNVRFRPKSYLKDLLSTLTEQQVIEMVTARKDQRARRKKATVSSGTLDRKRLARVRKLLRSRDPENVTMAMMVLEQIALPDDYRAVFETSGLIERLLKTDSVDIVESVAKIVAGTENESIRDQFWTLIGLIGEDTRPTELKIGGWVSSTTLTEFLGDPRNQLITSFDASGGNLSEIRLADLSQLKTIQLWSNPITTLELENLSALELVNIWRCGQLRELSLSGLDSLALLWLHDCSIGSIPEEIGTLRSLKELKLSGNPLEALPDSIGQLSHLETLDISSTSIKKLPKTISQLKSLEKLVLPTTIEALPLGLGQLSGLRELYFGDSYSSDEATTTRIILDLCRQVVGASGR